MSKGADRLTRNMSIYQTCLSAPYIDLDETCKHTCKHAHTITLLHIHSHTHLSTYTHTYTYTYAHTHT